MASMNALRGLLVAGAAVAAVVALVGARPAVTGLMVLAIAVHGAGSVWLRRRAAASATPTPPAESA